MEEGSKFYFPVKDVTWPKPVRGSAKTTKIMVVDATDQVFYFNLLEFLYISEVNEEGLVENIDIQDLYGLEY